MCLPCSVVTSSLNVWSCPSQKRVRVFCVSTLTGRSACVADSPPGSSAPAKPDICGGAPNVPYCQKLRRQLEGKSLLVLELMWVVSPASRYHGGCGRLDTAEAAPSVSPGKKPPMSTWLVVARTRW